MLRQLAVALCLSISTVANAEPYIDFRLVDGGPDAQGGAYVREAGASGLLAWDTIGCLSTTIAERTGSPNTSEQTVAAGSVTYTLTQSASVWDLGCHTNDGVTTKTVVIQSGLSIPTPPHPSTNASFYGSTKRIIGPQTIGGVTIVVTQDNLTWSFPYANFCVASGAWSGTKQNSGSQTINRANASASYTLTCFNSSGSAIKSVTLN